jgi:poly(A) polymerase/tRNA nucleotidyltransferase (CCA-adding enzyme)
MKAVIPSEVRAVHRKLLEAGYEAFLVGGCVRDALQGRTPKDWDITTNAKPEEIQPLYQDTFYENDFGTVGVVTESDDPRLKVIEVTPYRIEGAYSNARHPDEVSWATNLSDDLRRRDFTINAMAYDPESDTLIDEHGGREDLEKRLLVCVGNPSERFAEDALRMLRAIRIAAELDFALDSGTAEGIAQHATQIERISRERVRDELIRIFESDRTLQAIFLAQKLGILRYIIPEIEAGIGCAQNAAHSYDVFEHLLRSLQHAADNAWPLEVRVAALFHDIGKPATRRYSEEKKDWTFYGHDVVGARLTKKILSDLRFPRDFIQRVETLVRWHMFFSDPDTVTLTAVRRLIARVGSENMQNLVNLRVCDRIGTGRPKAHPFRLRKYMSMIEEAERDPISVSMLKIDGTRLIEMGEKPGPRIGWILHALLEEVLDEPRKNTSEYIEFRAKKLMELADEQLKEIGESGKGRREAEEEAAIRGLREKYHVS